MRQCIISKMKIRQLEEKGNNQLFAQPLPGPSVSGLCGGYLVQARGGPGTMS